VFTVPTLSAADVGGHRLDGAELAVHPEEVHEARVLATFVPSTQKMNAS